METFLSGLACAQHAYGHKVSVLAHAGVHPSGLSFTDTIPIHRCSVWGKVRGVAPVAPGLPFRLLSLCLGRDKPDLIHAHVPNPAAIWAATLVRIPLVLHWHSDVLFPEYHDGTRSLWLRTWRLIEKCILRRAARIITTSAAYLESSEFLRSWQSKCRVIPLALPNPPIPDYTHPAVQFMQKYNEVTLLAVGRLSHYKGFDILLRAMALLPHARLCIIGSGECELELSEMINEMNLRERVLLAGDVPDGVVRACMQCSRAVVLPSLLRTEAFGMVLLEAMREGRPCIASDIPGSGISTVVSHEKTGLLVAPGDVDSLTNAIHRLLHVPEQAKYLGESGYERWLSQYGMKGVVDALNKLYTEVCSSHRQNSTHYYKHHSEP